MVFFACQLDNGVQPTACARATARFRSPVKAAARNGYVRCCTLALGSRTPKFRIISRPATPIGTTITWLRTIVCDGTGVTDTRMPPYQQAATPIGALTPAPIDIPDITLLQKTNNGVFPFDYVYDTIDGR